MRTNNEIREKIVKMYLEGYSVARIMDSIGIKSSRTIYKVLNEAGVTSTERQEREADVINVTITDAAVVRWLRSQPNAAEAIAKLVYSQIDRTPAQNPRIAKSAVDAIKEIPIIFYDELDFVLGEEKLHVPESTSNSLFLDIVRTMQETKYPQAAKAKNVLGNFTITF